MALTSPGVEVSVINESFYVPSDAGTTPLFIVASSQDKEQLDVLFVDGNLRNTTATNLKTVCANCQRLGSTRRLGWRVGDLVADD